MKREEPPSTGSTHLPTFLLGQDGCGNWVVQDDTHRCGGLFVNRAQAIKFALFENGNHPDAIVVVPGILELDMSATAVRGSTPILSDIPRLQSAA